MQRSPAHLQLPAVLEGAQQATAEEDVVGRPQGVQTAKL